MKFKSTILAAVFSTGLFAPTVDALDITIDRDNLSVPSQYATVYLFDSENTRTLLRTTQTISLSDGTYRLATYDGNPYGSFTISADIVTGTTGAVAYDNDGIFFDTSKLANATIHFDEIDDDSNGILFSVSGISNIIRSTPTTFYLPDGDYSIGFRAAGSEFGKMIIQNQIISVDRFLFVGASGDIHFDLDSLASVTITRGDELKGLSGIGEVGGQSGLWSGRYNIHLTPGTYAVNPRGSNYSFGKIIVDDSNNVSSTGNLLTDNSTNTVSFDIEHLPLLTFNWSQLSDTESDKKVYYAAVYEHIGSANNREAYYPLNSEFFTHGPTSSGNRLGDFMIDGAGNVETTGYMQVENATTDVNGQIHTTLGFKLCEMNSVTITPAANKRYWFHPHFNTNLAATVYLPNGEYKLLGDDGARATFSVDADGLNVSENNQNHVTLSYNPSSCAPPDTDEDGVIDSLDICPATPAGAIVDGDGCSVPQGINAECSAWKARSHGKYVSCVTRVVNRAANDGLISNDDKGALISEAAKK